MAHTFRLAILYRERLLSLQELNRMTFIEPDAFI
jgi:hypothetical protein